MAEHLGEDDLLELASGDRSLSDAPALEAHLADCAACSGLLCTLLGSSARDERRDLVGRTLGPYRLDGLIGAGAMGEVYRAWDQRLERAVAVKAVSARFADSPERVRRLEAEARAAASIAHPNVVTVFDTGVADGIPYIVSELIVGETLRSSIDRGAVDRTRAIEIGVQLARGVAAAHARGVVHRDLKPGNLIVTEDGTLKILDFGLAKLVAERDLDVTEPGTLLGTCGYLSPEQARGEPADARSDIFAVGAILYELLARRRAFDGATFAERLSSVLRDMPPPLADPAWPIVERCLDKDPRKRFASADDLAWVLHDLEHGARPSRAARTTARATVSRRLFLAGTATAGVGGLVVGRLLAPAPPPAFVPEFRQLTFRPGRVARARFTHDGGTVVYSALWEDAPSTLYSARLAGGGTRALDVPSAQLLAVSARGQLAVSLNHRYVEGFYQRGQLALAPLEGGTPRALGVEAQDADFMPDGEQLVWIRHAGGRFRLELAEGRVLFEAGWMSNPRVSPDGSLVACCVHESPGDDRGDLVVVSRAGGAARTIARGWSSIDGVAWSAHGRVLWISASREGGNNTVRAIALDGRELAHVPSVGRLRVHDLARGGTMAVTHVSGRLRVAGLAPGHTSELDLGLSDVTLVGDMSADGRTIVLSEFGDVDTAQGIYLRATDGTSALRLGSGMAFDLADDGRGLLGMHRRLAQFPLDRGQPRDLPARPLSSIHAAAWAAGGIVVLGSMPAGPRRLWFLDAGGAVFAITGDEATPAFRVSLDGRRVALVIDDKLCVYAIGPGAGTHSAAPRVVAGSFVDEVVCGWSTDDRHVYVRSCAWPIRVRRVDVESAQATTVLEVTPPRLGLRGVDAFVLAADASAYAYSYGQELSRLWSMTTRDPLA